MKYTTIRIEGAILSADILDKIEQGEIGGQLSRDFGFDTKIKVKDEIARAWADAQDLWRIFKRQKERVAEREYGTTETKNTGLSPCLDYSDMMPSSQRRKLFMVNRMQSATAQPILTGFRFI